MPWPHFYDGVERRYHHTDVDRTAGLAAVARVLKLAAPVPLDARYDLSFYSGGVGVFDELAITLTADAALWRDLAERLSAKSIDEPLDDERRVQLEWLVAERHADSSSSAPLRDDAVRFLNARRRDFQSECRPTDRILFCLDSDVNCYGALWGDEATLNYLEYAQG